MPGSVPLFRVFISSTFADLAEERRTLHERVFPDVARMCAGLGAHFQAIDLRWGVTTEASRDQRAVSVCLEEIDRCFSASRRPCFLLLLGDRYGWRPLPETVDADHLRRLRARMTGQDAELVARWYVEDRNAVPSHYRLQPRRGPFEDDEAWAPVERALRDVLRLAGSPGPHTTADGAARVSVDASVTELEVGRALACLAPTPGAFHAFFRTVTAVPTDGSARFLSDGDEGFPDSPAAEAVRGLRARVRGAIGDDHVHEYLTAWEVTTASPARDYLETLRHDVATTLQSAITAELIRESTDVGSAG